MSSSRIKDDLLKIQFDCIECQRDLNSIHDFEQHINKFSDHEKIQGPNFCGINCERCHSAELSNLNVLEIGGSMLLMYCNDCIKDIDYKENQLVNFKSSDGDLFWLRLKQFIYLKDLSCSTCNSNWMLYSINNDCICENCINKNKPISQFDKISDSDNGFLSSLFNDNTFAGASEIISDNHDNDNQNSEWNESATISSGNWYEDEDKSQSEPFVEQEQAVQVVEQEQAVQAVEQDNRDSQVTKPSPVEKQFPLQTKQKGKKKRKSLVPKTRDSSPAVEDKPNHQIEQPKKTIPTSPKSSHKKTLQIKESKIVAENFVQHVKFCCTDCETTVNTQYDIERHTQQQDHLRIEGSTGGLIFCEKCQCGDIRRINVAQVGGSMLMTYCDSCLKTVSDSYDENLLIVKYGEDDFIRRLKQYLILRDLQCIQCNSKWILHCDLDSNRVLCEKCIKSSKINNSVDDTDYFYLASVFKDPSLEPPSASTTSNKQKQQEQIISQEKIKKPSKKSVTSIAPIDMSNMTADEIRRIKKQEKNARQRERRKAKAELESQNSRETTEEYKSAPISSTIENQEQEQEQEQKKEQKQAQPSPEEIEVLRKKAKRLRQKENKRARLEAEKLKEQSNLTLNNHQGSAKLEAKFSKEVNEKDESTTLSSITEKQEQPSPKEIEALKKKARKSRQKENKRAKLKAEKSREVLQESQSNQEPSSSPQKELLSVTAEKPTKKLNKSKPFDFSTANKVVSHIIFSCTDCEKPVNSFNELTAHIESSSHLKIEGPNLGSIFCEKCHNGDIRELEVAEVGGTMLMVYCKECLKETNFENSKTVDYNSGDSFLRRLRQYLFFKSLACSKCGSDWMVNYADGTIICDKCTPSGSTIVSDSDDAFLASIFLDPSLEINSDISLDKSPVTIDHHVEHKVKNDTNNVIKKEIDNNSQKLNSPKQKSFKKEKSFSKSKDFFSLPTQEAEMEEPEHTDPYLMKVKRVQDLIKASTPDEQQLTFNTVKEYLQHISYNIFLEELFENDIFSDLTIEWSKKKQDKYQKLTASFSYNEVMEAYVPEKMRHLRKSAFTMGQGIILLRKRDKDLLQKPEIWCCSVAYNKVTKVGRKKLIQTHLDIYNWNETQLPAGASSKGFAILPCSAVVTRVLQAMANLENPSFKDLLLGKTPIKQIFFKNYIGKYTNNLNDSQKIALQSALNNKITILKGPPGSGKTSTIYEMILQLVDQLSYYPVLVVAASNLAVDNIAEKLLDKHKDDIIRIVSVSKESEYNESHVLGSVCLHHKLRRALPMGIREDYDLLASGKQNEISKNRFSKLLDATKQYSEQLVAQAKIIFSTTVTIAGPYLKRVKQLPVVIMDEATQTSEPASLIPLAAPGIKKIIFVGDEAQLSAFTRVKALEMSLFERTLKNGSYEKPIMLDTQYRMHPEISDFARTNFYNGELKDGVTSIDRQIPNIKYPIYFWDHAGFDGASESKVYSQGGEETGYSLVNKKEAQFICRIIENLIVDKQIEPERIGIMTGYAGQRDLISSLLESNKVINPFSKKLTVSVDKEDIKASKGISVHQVNGIIVASVDAFQGREKDFIVMSCVRSNPQGNIGFLRDRRRMNVALTRAKCSLIFSGDAQCLKRGDLVWKKYIQGLESKGYVFQGKLTY